MVNLPVSLYLPGLRREIERVVVNRVAAHRVVGGFLKVGQQGGELEGGARLDLGVEGVLHALVVVGGVGGGAAQIGDGLDFAGLGLHHDSATPFCSQLRKLALQLVVHRMLDLQLDGGMDVVAVRRIQSVAERHFGVVEFEVFLTALNAGQDVVHRMLQTVLVGGGFRAERAFGHLPVRVDAHVGGHEVEVRMHHSAPDGIAALLAEHLLVQIGSVLDESRVHTRHPSSVVPLFHEEEGRIVLLLDVVREEIVIVVGVIFRIAVLELGIEIVGE